ncbi:MAG: hypothetical protein JO313_15350 [Verrucomicrobia bacterium]|nr:hypothetical protein [Verrucomicrobiota bacterium]
MSIEQNSTPWNDSQVLRQTGATKIRKLSGLVAPRRQAKRAKRPLNVLGCLALIHAVRSAGTGARPRMSGKRTTGV